MMVVLHLLSRASFIVVFLSRFSRILRRCGRAICVSV
jgi:hypothetical protein